ncbi:universal stress protein [Trinickia caryophylli]|uniref:Universal stress protein family protein n=1 Tax=Trinickia caryophylli TaxID=28094 RepID=A0A1X7GFW1_TRICW|nr:universal stress protein [Trinickia caryophylli]PMS08751.1 universal stress protein UspA [Trinickia caryophylli]TRX13907.1 universal stress protein [Trinickia caryophylli]WQE15498.1 universal stress protein [Trinickia caryophylli]SMF69192.1 Universal stress protein family protein [Trinickia caryophylli]GLU33756.1 universal stress protein A [Trinickia caryophylli]
MSYTSILVHLDTSEAAERRLEFAFKVAHQFDAGLRALLTLVRPESGSFYVMAGAADYLMRQDRRNAERAESLERHLKTEASHTKVKAEWEVTRDDPNAAVPAAARLADLVIAGQPDLDDPESLVADQFAANLVLQAGRPVLFMPYAGVCATVGTRVLVAWDGSREAARAIGDAMPFICRAKQTTVVAIDALEDEPPESRLPGADIAAAIARHGAQVGTVEIEGVHSAAIGDALLSRAADLGADLIVMGGYAHSRWREIALGGATQTMLRTMTLPVLMSH